jgi:mRNA interferase RelE/StbE
VVRRRKRRLAELEISLYGYNTTALVSQPDRRRLRVGDWFAMIV